MTIETPPAAGIERLMRRCAAAAAAVLAAFAVFAFAWHGPRAFINADAWAILDMARTFDEKFYQGVMVRQFHLSMDYGASYPFFAPALTYVVDAVSGLGVYALFVAAAVTGWAAAALCLPIMRKAAGDPPERTMSAAAALAAVLLAVLAFNIGEFYRDVYRASTIPMALLFILAATAALPQQRGLGAGRAFVVGLLMGGAAATRFDVNLLVAAFVGVAAAHAAAGERLRAAAAYTAGVVLTALPWIAYSLTVFGRFYASDNAVVAVAARQLHSLDVIDPGEPTLFVDFAGWKARFALSAADFVVQVERMWAATPFAWAFVAGAGLLSAGLLATALRGGRRAPDGAPPDDDAPGNGAAYRRSLALTAAASMLLLFGPVATGYQMNTRYYSMTLFLGAVAVVAAALGLMRVAERRAASPAPRRATEAVFLALIVFGLWSLPAEVWRGGGRSGPLFNPENLSAAARLDLDACIPAGGRTFLLYRWTNMKLQDGLRHGVLARRTTVILPHNWTDLTDARRNAFLRDARVSHILLDEDEDKSELLPRGIALEPALGCRGLYRLTAVP